MNKVFYVVGAGLIVGAAAVTAMYLLNNKKKKDCDLAHDYKNSDEERAVDDKVSTEVAFNQDEPVYEDIKSSAIGSIYSRHEGATTIMSDSVETIRENIKVSESTNDEIDKISTELNKMLSED